MALSGQDIVRKEFRESLRGYNQADVDLFLDEVVEEFTRLAEENQRIKVRLAAVQQEVARLREGRGASAAPQKDAGKVESEVRARVRRFLEEQIRLIDSSERSPTAERIARALPADPEPVPAGAEEQREPFWAGE